MLSFQSQPSPSIILTPEMLPSTESELFRNSSFFNKNDGSSLPTPTEVREWAIKSGTYQLNRPPPVRFPKLGLLVKFGAEITIAEGQCLWAIRRLLPSVPVPEVYGWCRDGNQVFIYMELIQGETLEKSWSELSMRNKDAVCLQLKEIIGCLGQFRQPADDRFIGNVFLNFENMYLFSKLKVSITGQIGRQPLQDIIFADSCNTPETTFSSVAVFHDWFTTLKIFKRGSTLPHPMRQRLSDNAIISFTHGDLHRSNIIVSKKGDGSIRICAIVDWHQSGWLPSYWEYCKTLWTASIGKEWGDIYVPKFVEPHENYDYWDYFVLRLGV